LSEQQWPKVSIITVNFNGTEVTLELLASLSKVNYPNFEVIVVDNCSTTSTDEIVKQYPETIFIQAKANLGFAGGNNLGIKAAKGEYYLLLNNDTEVAPDFIQPLVETFRNQKKVGCVSSKLIYFFHENTVQYAGNFGMNHYTGRTFTRGFKEQDQGQYDSEDEIKIAHGAAMMFSKEVVEKVGLMEDDYFLYYEELDYCYRIAAAGYKLYYNGKSNVLHKESITTGKNSPLKEYYLTRNRLLFTKRNIIGIQKYLAILFFLVVAVPKRFFLLLVKGEYPHAKALFYGLLWHINKSIKPSF